MKRSLILLLVVALLATMVPTIALAAEKTKPLVKTFEEAMVAMPDIYAKLSRAPKGWWEQNLLQWYGQQNIITRFTVTGGKEGEADEVGLKVVWTTSDRNIVGFRWWDTDDHNTNTQYLDNDGNTLMCELDGRAVGDAVITGKIYWNDTIVERAAAPLATVSFNVHVQPVWETKVTIEDHDGKEQTSQKYEYWLVDEWKHDGDITSVEEIPDYKARLEDRAHVHSDPDDPDDWNADDPESNPSSKWPATYGVGELVWTSSDETIAKLNKHGTVWFTGKAGTVTIRATAKEEAAYPHTPKYAEITYIIHEKPAKEDPSYEAFKKVEFTASQLGVHRGCTSTDPYKGYLNVATYLELYPRPVGWYRWWRGSEHADETDGNYGVDDNIRWSSSNENIMWICQDPDHYTNNAKGPNWKECYVEVSPNAKPGDKVKIRATSMRNPSLYDEIELVVVDNDKKSVRFERTSVTLRVGDVETIKVLGNDWSTLDSSYFTLTSSNPEIADAWTVANGVAVRGREPGTTSITLESTRYQFKITANVTVVTGEGVKSVTVPAQYKNIKLALYDVDSRPEVFEGVNSIVVNVNVNPDDAWYRATWTSSDPSVAYVVPDNVNQDDDVAEIRAAGVGSCVITVTVDDGLHTFTETMNVTVAKAEAVKLTLNKKKAAFYLRKGGDNTLQLTATNKKTGEEVPVTWTSSDKTIAKISKSGLVKFKKEGVVKFTATTKDGNNTQKSCIITVKKAPVKKIVVESKKLSMKAGETAILLYRIKPAKAYNQAVSFKSSDKKVVSVDKYGNIEAKKAGKAVITITAKDGSGVTAKVTVTVKDVADNADVDVIEVVEDDSLELTLDDFDGIEDLGIEDEVVLDTNNVIELPID